MKTFTTLFVALAFMTGISMASQLTIKMSDNSLFTIELDDIIYSNPSSSFYVSNIGPGVHYVKIMKYYPAGTMRINGYVFDGTITVPSYTSSVTAMLDDFNTLVVTSSSTGHIHHPNYASCNYGSYGTNGYYSNNTTYNGYYSSSAYNGYYNDNYCPGMSPFQFESLKYTMMNTSFDNSKLQIAKQAVTANGVSSAQVCELMGLFIFESKKLEFAKFAYGYTVDSQNYYLVNNAFTFSSSINELNDFIMGYNW
ncbi:MAG: DUF4476 domain-containing protein [Bacteroidota bacterium]